MMNLIKMESINCFKRKELHFIFLFMIVISIVAFCIECLSFYGTDMKFIRTFSESSILQGTYAGSVRKTLLLIIPLLSSLIYSDSLHVDFNNGVLKSIATRESIDKYIMSKSIVIVVYSFLVFFLALTVNLLLVSIVFPKEGLDNMYSLPPYDISLINYSKENFLDIIRIGSPLLFDFISICIISLFAGLLSLFSFAIYFWFLSKNKIFGLFFSFMLYLLFNISLSILHLDSFSLLTILRPIHEGSMLELVSMAMFLLGISLSFIRYKVMQENWLIDS